MFGGGEFLVKLVQGGWVCEKVVDDGAHDDGGRVRSGDDVGESPGRDCPTFEMMVSFVPIGSSVTLSEVSWSVARKEIFIPRWD
jgi:hypothetical protein